MRVLQRLLQQIQKGWVWQRSHWQLWPIQDEWWDHCNNTRVFSITVIHHVLIRRNIRGSCQVNTSRWKNMLYMKRKNCWCCQSSVQDLGSLCCSKCHGRVFLLYPECASRESPDIDLKTLQTVENARSAQHCQIFKVC